MIAEFETWRAGPGSPVTEALRSMRLVAARHAEPRVLGVAPVARMNPFQSQLYRSFPQHGIAPAPVNEAASFGRLAEVAGLAPVTVHLHWLSFVLGQAADRRDARARLDEFRAGLDAFLGQPRTSLLWTVHNLIPHDARYVDLELELRNAVSDAADLVHVMSGATADAVAPDTVLDPAKTVLVPHPNYRGCYADHVTREAARLALGIEPDELVFVLFGAVKPYKGLDGLLDAFDDARPRLGRQARLIVAGQPDGSDEARRFVDRCTVHPDVLVAPKRIPSEHVQHYLRAADVGLAPYDRVLNSGAVLLYTSFDLPVVVPDAPTVRESLSDGTHVAYGEGGLAGALVAAERFAGDVGVRDTVRRHTDRFDAATVSASLAEAVRTRTGGAP